MESLWAVHRLHPSSHSEGLNELKINDNVHTRHKDSLLLAIQRLDTNKKVTCMCMQWSLDYQSTFTLKKTRTSSRNVGKVSF